MKRIHLITFTASVCAMLSGCAANTPFPPEVMEKVSPTFHFEAWRDAGPTNESGDRKSTRLNSSHPRLSRMPSSA